MIESFYDIYTWFIELPYFWVIYVFMIVLGTLFAAFFLKKALSRLENKTLNTNNIWDDGLVGALQAPSHWCIWLYGFTFAADTVAINAGTSVIEMTNKIRAVGIIVLASWFFVRLIRSLEKNFTNPKYRSNPMDPTTAGAVGKLLRAATMITSVLIVMQNLGYSISGVLAFGGIGGLAIGLAAKDMLANFFGGLTVYLDKPFRVGDWIRSPDQEIEGTVEDIGWRVTRIRTFDKRPLYVQNSTFTHISIENPSRMSNRRIKETIGIRYDDALKMEGIVVDVKTMLQQHSDIDTSKTLIVNFNAFASSSLDFFIYTFTKTTNWIEYHQIKQDVMLRILNIIDQHGAECAFPTSTLHIAGADFSEPIRSV